MIKYIKLLTLLFYIITAGSNYSQIQFQCTLGGNGDDRAWSVIQVSDGGYVIAGETTSGGAGGIDFYIVKIDSTGVLLWDKTIGFELNEIALSMVQTADGGYILAGFTDSFVSILENDILIVKLDAAGSMQWHKIFRLDDDEVAISITQTTDGGYAVIGSTISGGAGGYDMYILKLDVNGNIQWTRAIGGPDYDFGYSIKQTADGGYIAAGYTASFGAGIWDMLIVKLDSLGNIQWSRTIGGTETDAAFSIIQTTDGGYIAAGYTISFGGGYVDMYFVKLDSAGALQWTKTAGGSQIDVAYSIFETADGGFVAAGYTYSTGAGLDDMCLIKYNAEGNIQWSKTIGGSLYDDAFSVFQTADESYIIAGRTNSFGAGNYDMFVAKLGQNGNTCSNSIAASFNVSLGGIINSVMLSSVSLPPQIITQLPLINTIGTQVTVCTLTDINSTQNEIPESFKLYQNYPNPFNPITMINFDIPKKSAVTLVIYDVTGKIVSTLINNEIKTEGNYGFEFDAANLPSGIYFYKLTAGEFTESKKMILVK